MKQHTQHVSGAFASVAKTYSMLDPGGSVPATATLADGDQLMVLAEDG